METLTKSIVAFIGVLGMLLIWVAITTLPVQVLWNLLVPQIFGLTKLGFWQTFGLLVLVRLMFNTSSHVSTKKEK